MNYNEYFISIDLGGTFMKGAIVRGDGKIVSKITKESSNSNLNIEYISCSFNNLLNNLLNSFNEKITAILICIPGPFDYQNGTSLMKHKYVSLYQSKIADLIENEKLKTLPIYFENDAISFAFGGYFKNNLNSKNKVITITLGTGLGYVLIENGTVLKNELGSPKDVMYNKPFLNGKMEDYFSAKGLVNLYKEMTNNDISSPKELYDLAKVDFQARECFVKFGNLLAKAIYEMTNDKFDILILGGAISKSYEFFKNAFINKSYKVIDSEEELSLIGNVFNYYRRVNI